jgi:hypothetical protein
LGPLLILGNFLTELFFPPLAAILAVIYFCMGGSFGSLLEIPSTHLDEDFFDLIHID